MDALLPKPINGKDFYIDRLQSHTVIISVTVGGIEGRESEEDICHKAVEGIRNGTLDGESEIVSTTNIRDIELDFVTDEPFDREAWTTAKLQELGLNKKGEPLRPYEKDRPPCETTLTDFSLNASGILLREDNTDRFI